MLVHSRTLYHLYPEQQWLDNLQDTHSSQTAAAEPGAAWPRPCKANTTAYNLRRLQSREDLPTALDHIKDFLDLYRAA